VLQIRKNVGNIGANGKKISLNNTILHAYQSELVQSYIQFKTSGLEIEVGPITMDFPALQHTASTAIQI
jgi:hypothetical protein